MNDIRNAIEGYVSYAIKAEAQEKWLERLNKQLTELERLAEIGKATEKVFEQNCADIDFLNEKGQLKSILCVEELVEWYRESEEEQ